LRQGAGQEALASRLGDALPDALELHAPETVEGIEVSMTLRPRDGAALARCLAALNEHGAAALVRGGGSRIGAANLPARVDCLLATSLLDEIDTFDAEDGVVHVGGGTSLAALRRTVEPEGWEVPLDAWGPDATVGGVLSAAAFGPRLLGFGRPRDAVLGLEVALASGERTRCGGRVVKNVTGYDLAKLYTGACGTLGVIEGAWLRLRPAPEEKTCLAGWVESFDDAQPLGLDVSRRASVRCAAVVAPSVARRIGAWAEAPRGAHLLVVEVAGDRAVVAEDVDWLGDRLSLARPDGDALGRLAALEGGHGGGVRGRLSVLPSAVTRCARDLGDALLSFHPGTGMLYAGAIRSVAADSERDVSAHELAGAIEEVASESGASVVFDELPIAERRTRDVFGEPGPERRLMAALKERFDPRGVLNPGRFQGRL